MSKMASVTIDGKEIKVPEGTNLVIAAEKAGVHIPNLCYMKGMKGVGACRLCLVEIEGGKGQSIACNTKVKDGMVVSTDSEQIRESRRFVIDMILSMHPLDCMTCTKAGVCQLQKYAYDLEVKESTFTRKKFGYPTDEANPFIKRDPEYCIICGRCVRVCEEQGTNVLDFMGRGVGAKVITENDKPLQESSCTFCGSCVDACPVNALLEADRWRKGREWEYETSSSACTFCGNGCSISVSTKDGAVQKVRSAGDEASVTKYICAFGRFGFDHAVSDTRLTSPMMKDKGKMKEISWDEAMDLAAKKLKAAGKSAGILTNAAIQNEDAVAAVKLAKDALKTQSYTSTLSLYATADIMSRSQAADLDEADVIVVAGLSTSQHERVLPALDAALKKISKRGAKLVVVNSGSTSLDTDAAVRLGGKETDSLKSLAAACVEAGMKADKKLADTLKGAKATEEAKAAAELISKAENPVILASPALFDAAQNLAVLKGSAVAVGYEANAKGVAMMGLSGKDADAKDIAGANLKALVVVGEMPSSIKPKAGFLITVQSHKNAIVKEADLVLPAAVSYESAGSIVNYLGSLIKMEACVAAPLGVRTNKEILLGMAKALGKDIKVAASDVSKAAGAGAKASAMPFEAAKGLETSPEKATKGACSSVMATTRMLWLKESPAGAAK